MNSRIVWVRSWAVLLFALLAGSKVGAAASFGDGSDLDSQTLASVRALSTAVSDRPAHPSPPARRIANPRRHAPAGFAFRYEDAMGNRIDTIDGSATKDRNSDRDTTIALRLTRDELDAIWQRMAAMRVFDLPDTGQWMWRGGARPRLTALAMSTASAGADEWVRLDVRVGTRLKSMQWPGSMRFNLESASDDMLRLQALVNRIWFEVAQHRAYRALPAERSQQW